MIFLGTEIDCAELIAELGASLGYPRGYTQADVDSGLVVRVGGGIHVPLDQIRTETISQPQAVRVDAEGRPVDGERVAHLPPLDAPNKARVAKARQSGSTRRASKRSARCRRRVARSLSSQSAARLACAARRSTYACATSAASVTRAPRRSARAL